MATAPNNELRDELLAMMAEDQAVRTGIAPPGDDRTADGELAPRTPIEDEDSVDERRSAVGLGTLEEYYQEFRDSVDAEPTPSP